ncbi:MAG: hypothetical protein AAFV33_16795 [Chloroflexota bacterium]
MHILLIFIDGIGLGDDNPEKNPFTVAQMPTLTGLTNGKRWVRGIGRQESDRALFLPLDPRMGVQGRPQSGTGHATIITGRNVPTETGTHYGPKPDADTRAIVDSGSFFTDVVAAGKTASLLTAYPPFLLHNIARGKSLPTSFQAAAMNAGQALYTIDDLRDGKALSADWTGRGWHRDLNYRDVPVMSLDEGGKHMVTLSRQFDFALQSHIFTDYVGHRGEVPDGVRLLERLDAVMAGALSTWQDDEGLMVLISDHGNMEDLSIRQHTENDVPCLIIGEKRHEFAEELATLADLVPSMRHLLL